MERAMEIKTIDRRFFVTTLFGAAGVAAVAAVLPPSSKAMAKVLLKDEPDSDGLPKLDELQADDEVEQVAYHYGHPHMRRRRRRVRRWRRICRREWWNGIYRRRCRRRPFWIWLSIG
jgi:hypothetical protein